MSASQIKIMEPGAVGVGMNGVPAGSEGERLVVITGQPPNIQMAVQLLYHVSTGQSSFRKADDWPGFYFCSDWNKKKQNFGSQTGLVDCFQSNLKVFETQDLKICFFGSQFYVLSVVLLFSSVARFLFSGLGCTPSPCPFVPLCFFIFSEF